MRVRYRGFALVLLAASAGWSGCLQAARATPAGAEPSGIPRGLEDWRAWALKGQEFLRCPFSASGDPTSASAHRCAWPERLQLEADAHGGRFAQRWHVYAESWIALPGDASHWPQDVALDGNPAAVVSREDMPYVLLPAGTHALIGRWSWDVRPETLPIPDDTALLEVTVDGKPIEYPQRADGRVALGQQKQVVEPRQLELQIHRLIEDGEPVRLETRLHLRAAGDAREESLGHVLPDGFIPLSLESPFPARLDSDGNLRVQVRPGSFELTLIARQTRPGAELRAPSVGSLVREEIWSFAANDRLRTTTVEGAPGIDPGQAQVPADWREYPAFRLEPGATLRVIERSRGLSNADQNRLRLHRSLWLDFDHEGWTARDELSGTLRRNWRLDLRAPYRLESVTTEGQALLVTNGAAKGETGVELRTPVLALTALSRINHPFARMPATGWTQPFESVSGELYLPPGHRLLAVLGADESPTAWLDRWGLWNLFGLLVVVAFARWLAGWRVAAVGGIGLLLTYQAEPALIWSWGNLLAAVALARAVSDGRLARAARLYRDVSFVLLALALVPFAWTEVRHAIYPQLEIAAAVPPIQTQVVEERVSALRLALPAPTLSSSAAKREQVVVTGGIRQPQALAPYAPNTLIQAGPGIPSWNYGVHPFAWSGPVDPGQTVRFVVLGPWEVAIWRIAGVALLVAFLIQLARLSYGSGPGRFSFTWRRWGSATAMPILLIGILALPQAAHAQSFPSGNLLRQLKARLTEAPRCAPSCAEVLTAQVQVRGEVVHVDLTASALAELAVAVPSAGDRWRIDSVTVDGNSSLAIARDGNGALWVPLVPGVHAVRIDARLTGENLHLNFPMAPRRVTVDAPGWSVAGIGSNRLLSGAIDLTRERRVAASDLGIAGAASQEFPAFVRVTRQFRMGVDWSLATTVERIAPSESAFTVAVPLVSGESVLTEGLQVRPDHSALVGFANGEHQRTWSSSLQRMDRLSLRLPAMPAREEVWRFIVSPQWRVAFGGLPAVLPENSNAAPWVFEYHPRVGEVLTLEVSRPAAVAGSTLAIDGVAQSVNLGRHSSEHELQFQYRSTRGGQQTISLPNDAEVTLVSVDGTAVALRPENGELALSLLPGRHSVDISWRSRVGASLASRPDRVDLHAPASNVQTTLSLSADRWPLFAVGAGVGPAFLYWGELLVFLVVAFVLSRAPYSPLTIGEWLLLGFGLSTLSWGVLVVVAAWLFAMRWRERSSTATTLARSRFNALQVGLAALTVVAVAALVFSGVRYGLLAAPDMGVAGPGSYAGTFSWFVDRTNATLPQPTLYSLPMWVYRATMFAWALWIAAALVRWLRFSWRAWSMGGYWHGAVVAPQPPAGGPVGREST